MRTIRNKKIFDTDTAKIIDTQNIHDNGLPQKWELYEKKTGELFIFGGEWDELLTRCQAEFDDKRFFNYLQQFDATRISDKSMEFHGFKE
jgi:hypothetical protein